MANDTTPQSFTGTVSDARDSGVSSLVLESAADLSTAERRIAFVDSSALVALADAGDASHAAAVAAYRDLVGSDYRLFTTDYMIVETFDLLRNGPGDEVARQWLRACNLATCHVDESDIAKAKQRVISATESSPIGLADAISLAVMDRLGVTDVFAVDQTVLNAIA